MVDSEDLANKIADQLIDARARGLDSLDVDSRQQKPLVLTEVEGIAQRYCERNRFERFARIAQIKKLLKDALEAYQRSGHEKDAQLLDELFFDPSEALAPRKASERLDAALKKRGLTTSNFNELRRPMFVAFARFLLTFVEQRQRPRRRIGIGVAAAVALAALLGAGYFLLWKDDDVQTLPDSLPTSGGPLVSTLSIGPPSPGVKTFRQQQGQYGAPTFKDPFGPAGSGQKIPARSFVEVSCKVFAPSILSAQPDGYWYRIASAPWNNEYYAVANTFMNGDVIGGPVEHNTDFTVPDC